MTRARNVTTVWAVAVAFLIWAKLATAQEHLDDRIWIGGTGTQQWQLDANWDPAPFPNDPDRVTPDPAPTVIVDSIGANLSVNLAANLNVNVGATDVTVASLTLGSTSGAVTTNVMTSGAGRLVFENFEENDPTPPDPQPDNCAFNCGAALITSEGVFGSTNVISAPIVLNDTVHVTGGNNLTLSGGFVETGTGEMAQGTGSLSALSAGRTVFLTGNFMTFDDTTVAEDPPISFNSDGGSRGTIDVTGVISGAGRVRFGSPANSGQPRGTVYLHNANTYSGRTFIGRGDLILGNNNALGTAELKEEGASGVGQTGYNIISDNDARTITNTRIIGQWVTIKGQNSLTWSGMAYQDNTGGWINMLPAGKTLTLSGPQFPNHTEELGTFPLSGRILTFDGTGKTLITGGLHDEYDDPEQEPADLGALGNFAFQGTGTVVVSGGNSEYTGITHVRGANVHFATNADFGSTSQIRSVGGALGVDESVAANATFHGLLNNSSSPVVDEAGAPVLYDHGGLMLGTGEYGMNLDFTSGTLANAGDMSLAAQETNSSYTGTITPRNNTYRFGGGSGTLTLPNANQLTGARNVVATNGGTVNVTNTNNYTGTTSIVAKYMESLEAVAAADANPGNDIDDDNIPNDQRYVGTTLQVNSLANGGAASSIGSSTNAASNLYIQGSRLRYVGGATSTNRLFTIGSGGATIDASGSGALNFTNTGALGVDLAEARTGWVNAFATTNTAGNLITIRNLTTTEDLAIGMPIMSPLDGMGMPIPSDCSNPGAFPAPGICAGAVITQILSRTDVQIGIPGMPLAPTMGTLAFYGGTTVPPATITFGPAPERTLTLTGSNTGNNTLASVIPNASDGGVVGVTKEGDGKWILTATNTYTGSTRVEDGILSITNPYLADGSDVFMTPGATFDLNFVGTDVIDELFFNGLGQITGTWGAIGNPLAMFQSVFFTGTGLLQVMTPPEVFGDYNEDGFVNAADYVVWRKAATLGLADLPNDQDDEGNVDDDEYDLWRANFGAIVPGGGAGLGGGAVPEPATWLLASVAMLGLMGRARRRG